MKPSRFAVYLSRSSPYYLWEIQRLLADALQEAGFHARCADETGGFLPDVDWHLVIAAQDFFNLGTGKRLRRAPWPEEIILFNTTQKGSPARRAFERFVPRAHAVWDLHLESARALALEGWRAHHVPLGWVSKNRFFKKQPPSSSRRPIDFLFVGESSPRRERLLREVREALPHRKGKILLLPKQPVFRDPGAREKKTREILGLARRAKVVLNLHRRETPYFEWHRIFLHGLAQGAQVLSENTTRATPLRKNEDFHVAAPEDFPKALERLLKRPRPVKRNIAKWRLAPRLREAVRKLAVPQGNEASRKRKRVRAALDLYRITR